MVMKEADWSELMLPARTPVSAALQKEVVEWQQAGLRQAQARCYLSRVRGGDQVSGWARTKQMNATARLYCDVMWSATERISVWRRGKARV